MVKIALFALVALVVIVVLRQYHPEYALLVAVTAGGILLVFLALELASPIFTLIKLLEEYGSPQTLTGYILKALGICIITRFSADLCTDFGQTSLATKVEMAGKITLLLLSIPILQSILEVGLSLL